MKKFFVALINLVNRIFTKKSEKSICIIDKRGKVIWLTKQQYDISYTYSAIEVLAMLNKGITLYFDTYEIFRDVHTGDLYYNDGRNRIYLYITGKNCESILIHINRCIVYREFDIIYNSTEDVTALIEFMDNKLYASYEIGETVWNKFIDLSILTDDNTVKVRHNKPRVLNRLRKKKLKSFRKEMKTFNETN